MRNKATRAMKAHTIMLRKFAAPPAVALSPWMRRFRKFEIFTACPVVGFLFNLAHLAGVFQTRPVEQAVGFINHATFCPSSTPQDVNTGVRRRHLAALVKYWHVFSSPAQPACAQDPPPHYV